MAQARGASRLSRLRLLGLALVLPLVAVAGLAGAVALTRHGVDKTTPPAVATPAPPGLPTQFPAVFTAGDDFSIAAQTHAFGTLTIPEVALPRDTHIEVNVATAPVGLPSDLPVWRLDAAPLDPRAIAVRFGITQANPAHSENGMDSWPGGLGVNPGEGTIIWVPAGVAAPRLGGLPRDDGSAQFLALRWLDRAGLAPFAHDPSTVEQTSSGDSASLPEWTVTWRRSAPAYPSLPIDAVVARVAGDGTLSGLDFSRPRIAGGAMYHLRSWQEALRLGQQNHWYQPCCEPVPDSSTGTVHVTVTVHIEYALALTQQGRFAIPMYAFDEGGGYQPGLVPAIAP